MKIKSAIASLASLVVALSPKAVIAFPTYSGKWERVSTAYNGVQTSIDPGSVGAYGAGFISILATTFPDNTQLLTFIYVNCPARTFQILEGEAFNQAGELTKSTTQPSHTVPIHPNTPISIIWREYCH
jgi:hypothetical protein